MAGSISTSVVKPYFILLHFYTGGIKVYFLSQSYYIINHSGDSTVSAFIRCIWILKDIYYYKVTAPERVAEYLQYFWNNNKDRYRQ